MLINLYNGKPTSDFQDHYVTIVQLLEIEKRQNKGTKDEVNSESLFKLFELKIESIVNTVKEKLHEDCKKDGLIVVYG